MATHHSFVAHYAKTKDPINYAALGQHGLPKSCKKPSSRRKASSKKAMSAVKCIFAADDISQMKRVNEDPVASPSIVFVSLSFHCSRSRQLLKCSLWCHGKHSEFFNSCPTTTAAFLPRIGKGLILFYSTPITCVTVTQSIQCPSYCT